jgi:nucleotide-binding universal stress UspA family protein
MFQKVLFPVNQSHEAKQAIDVVVEVVQKYSAQLVVMSAVKDINSETETSSAQALLQEICDQLSKAGISAETKISQGKPELAICDAADELEVDLIIMGSQGMVSTKDHPDGSTSQKVINLSPCPVLVVP